jgi:hypothetical protein
MKVYILIQQYPDNLVEDIVAVFNKMESVFHERNRLQSADPDSFWKIKEMIVEDVE